MNKSRLTILFIIFSAVGFTFAGGKANERGYGLIIKASPAPNSQKTTLILENNLPVQLKEETTLSFDMLIREDYMFGFVFRIITNKQENIDLMLTVSEGKRHPILVIKEQAHVVPQEIITGQWKPASITFSKVRNEISLTYNNDTLNIPYSFPDVSDIRISFGMSMFKSFESSDIASVNIKDVRIPKASTSLM
jgi:hypothetical protein